MALFWYYLNNLARINPNEWCVIIPVMLRCWWIAWMFIKKGQRKISCLNIMLWPWLSSFWNGLIFYSTSNRYWMKCCGIKESISLWKVFISIVITSIWNKGVSKIYRKRGRSKQQRALFLEKKITGHILFLEKNHGGTFFFQKNITGHTLFFGIKNYEAHTFFQQKITGQRLFFNKKNHGAANFSSAHKNIGLRLFWLMK